MRRIPKRKTFGRNNEARYMFSPLLFFEWASSGFLPKEQATMIEPTTLNIKPIFGKVKRNKIADFISFIKAPKGCLFTNREFYLMRFL